MAQVRYIVDNVDEAVAFYVSKLGFELQQQFGDAIGILKHGDLTLLVSGPKAQLPDQCRMAPYQVPEAGAGSC